MELTGAGPHTVTLGFDLGTDITAPENTLTDGVPDSWWIEKNIPVNERTASADPDLDGLSNMREFVFGSNPLDSANGSPVLGVVSTNGVRTFTFTTVSGRTYQPQVSGDLLTWTDIGSPLVGNGEAQSVTDSSPAAKRFYRLVVSLP